MLKQKPYRPREKTCDVCGGTYLKTLPLQPPVCGPKCGYELRKKKVIDASDRWPDTRQQEKNRSCHEQEFQAAFNAYIRERDYDKPCVTCGIEYPQDLIWDAGHYLTVGAFPELRFNEDNCHKQCRACNGGVISPLVIQSGLTIRQLFRVELENRIGLERVEILEGPHEPNHYAADDFIAMKKIYRARTRELKRVRERSITTA